jgi:DNA-binding NtrC family response regulator
MIKINIEIVEEIAEEIAEENAEENGFPHSYIGIQREIRDLAQHRIKMALTLCNNNKSAAADLLGLPSYQTLTNWIIRYGVEND